MSEYWRRIYRCTPMTIVQESGHFSFLHRRRDAPGEEVKRGEVVIQTYSPEHYSIETAAKQDYEAFYQEELAYRTMMGYPPVEQLAAILVTSEDESLLETACSYMKSYAERMNRNQVRIIGPASPYVGKVNDVYRRVIYLKHARYEAMIDLKNKLEQYIEINSGFRKVRVQFDFNPNECILNEEDKKCNRKIREIGDDVLEKVCKEVTDMTDRTKVLIEDMLDTMYDAMGVGLAAPQVGILKRIVVIDIGEGPIILVNPEILETAGEQTGEEGCLSLPRKSGTVTRPKL